MKSNGTETTTASLITTAAAVGLQWRCPGANMTAVPRFKGHSQQGEDVALVHNLSCDQCGADHSRTYVEIGALDGVRYSNTLECVADHRTLSARVGHNTIFVHREPLPLVEERVLECGSLLHRQRGRHRRYH